MARTAEVKRDARIGEAEARRDAQIREAIAEEQRMAARFLNDTEIAKAQRDFELKKAAYDVEVQTKVGFFIFIIVQIDSTLIYILFEDYCYLIDFLFVIVLLIYVLLESRSGDGI